MTRKSKHDYLVVGAGFFGSVLAERIANDLGANVLVIDKRPHIGGNCYSETDRKTGIEIHRYGTHISTPPQKKPGNTSINLPNSIIIITRF